MEAENNTVADRQARERHLKELEAFMASTAYKGYRSAREQELQQLGDAIITQVLSVKSPDEFCETLRLAGEYRSQQEMLDTFEDARKILKDLIEEMLDKENENADNTKT